MPDNPTPRRHWFQFRLSTWFVLVAILAWAMMEWPWVVDVQLRVPQRGFSFSSGYLADSAAISWTKIEWRRSLNPALLYPALALAAFIGRKLARRIVERRREKRRATH